MGTCRYNGTRSSRGIKIVSVEAHVLEACFERKIRLNLCCDLGKLFGMIVEAAHIESELLLAAAVELADCIKHLLECGFPFEDDERGFGSFAEHVSARGVGDTAVALVISSFGFFMMVISFLFEVVYFLFSAGFIIAVELFEPIVLMVLIES